MTLMYSNYRKRSDTGTFRKIGEALGAQIEWDQETKTVTANKEDKVVLRIGDILLT